MPLTTRPDSAMASPAAVRETLEAVKDAVEKVETSTGRVNLKKLATEVNKLDTYGAADVVEKIGKEFAETVDRYITTCSGSTVVHDEVVPTSLDADQVSTVMQALIDAKKKAKKLDKNKDGVITEAEYHKAKPYNGNFATQLAGAAAYEKAEMYEYLMDEWKNVMFESFDSLEARVKADAKITDACAYHAKYKSGAEALTWAFRDLLSLDKKQAVKHINKLLERAETAGRPPLLRMVAGLAPDPDTLGKGHLTTAEIKELLGTDNLKAFVREKKAEIAERVGGNYETFYLAGKDLPGTDDPDYADLTDFSSDSYSSGC